MFHVKITDEQRQYAWALVKRVNFGHRGKFDGNMEQQYTGMLGQTVMADWLELDRPDGSGGFDNGIDFEILGIKVDLKTMGRTTPVRNYYVNNLILSQCDYETQVYVFSSINKETKLMTILGAISKHQLCNYEPIKEGTERTRSDGSKFAAGTAIYEIKNKDLGEVKNWTELTWRIHQIMV